MGIRLASRHEHPTRFLAGGSPSKRLPPYLEATLTQILPILAINSHALKELSAPVLDPLDSDIHALSVAMIETMRLRQGAGLAAPQVGIKLRMFVMVDDDGSALTVLNPEITDRSEEMQNREEGCLSMPGVFFKVERHKRVTMRYTDLAGAERVKAFEQVGAICVQHEIDHLDGIRAIDRVGPMKRQQLMEKWRKLRVRVERAADHLAPAIHA